MAGGMPPAVTPGLIFVGFSVDCVGTLDELGKLAKLVESHAVRGSALLDGRRHKRRFVLTHDSLRGCKADATINNCKIWYRLTIGKNKTAYDSLGVGFLQIIACRGRLLSVRCFPSTPIIHVSVSFPTCAYVYTLPTYSTLTPRHFLKSVAYGSQQLPCARDALLGQRRIDGCRYIVHCTTYIVILQRIRKQIAIDRLPRRRDIIVAIEQLGVIVYAVTRHAMAC